jgi:hypothetical protein
MEDMRRCLLSFIFFLSCCLTPARLFAAGPAFDLYGPKVDVRVRRGEVTLPISETPNLLPGDRLWVHPDLPAGQSAHFVLVVAFLRGPTNPPPPEWFTRVETWSRDVSQEGVFVTVPAGAQQALLFLAPETGGDFNTLRKAVHDQPGSFVRAAQDLQAASWERMRLENYLSDVRITSQTDPKALKTRTEMAARSLGIKINEDCFLKPENQQATCLSQNSEGMVLDDANAQSLVNQLANGGTLDLVNQLSYTNMAGGGVYSAYVGAVVDMAKILSSLHTAHFQYIPALALPTTDAMNLRLNLPPSFRNPKSVVVVALPPLGQSHPGPLEPVNPADSVCASKPELVLPAAGAPLFFATSLAHDLTLHIEAPAGSTVSPVDLPVKADPTRGGLIPASSMPALSAGELTAVLRGKWGFDDWEGPSFRLFSPQLGKWTLKAGDQSALVVGRADTLHLEGEATQCVEKIEEQTYSGKPVDLAWKSLKPDSIEVTVPLEDAAPGPITLAVYQHGLHEPDRLTMTAYEAEASLNSFTLNAGDAQALLKGTRLDEVAKASLEGVAFTPSTLSRTGNLDQLILKAAASTSEIKPGETYAAHVELKDGRRLQTPATIDLPRPQITLLSIGVQSDTSTAPSPVTFGNTSDLPVDGHLVFFLRSITPAGFPRDQKIEVAAADSSFHTLLGLSDGSLMLEDAKTAVGNLEPLARFGSSAFGPVRLRAVAADGVAGDWLPLGTLVRVPGFKELRCPHSAAKPCALTGTNLFLADSIAATPQYNEPSTVPPEFTGTQLSVPHPVNGVLYLKLRDDPGTVQTLTLPVTYLSPQQEPAARTHPAAAAPAAPATPHEAVPDPTAAPTSAPAAAAPQSTTPTAPTPPAAAATKSAQ